MRMHDKGYRLMTLSQEDFCFAFSASVVPRVEK